MRIRRATRQDSDNIHEIYIRAFPEQEGKDVATLAVELLSEETSPETIAYVAEIESTVVGHIAFSPVFVDSEDSWNGYILAPLCVDPDYQRRRIGSDLIETGMQELSGKGVNVLIVYGDPKYYGKFGFNADVASRYLPPYELQYPFGWQAVVLNKDNIDNSTVEISCVPALLKPALW